MSTIYYPKTQPDPDISVLRKRNWWSLILDEGLPGQPGVIYLLKTEDALDFDNATILSLEFNDGYDMMLDGGLDRPTVFGMAIRCTASTTHMCLASDEKPTPAEWKSIECPY